MFNNKYLSLLIIVLITFSASKRKDLKTSFPGALLPKSSTPKHIPFSPINLQDLTLSRASTVGREKEKFF